jgi:hypothetical protein
VIKTPQLTNQKSMSKVQNRNMEKKISPGNMTPQKVSIQIIEICGKGRG